MSPADLESRLAVFLARESGAVRVAITGLRKLPGGASRETWAFDAVMENGAGSTTRRLVLRRDPGPTSVQTDRAHEFRVLRAAHAAGVPVPDVLWLGDDPAVLGGRFFIMERIDGETLARRLLRDPEYAEARRVMAPQLGAILARIHAIDLERSGLDFLQPPAGDQPPAAVELERYEQLYRGLAPEPHPVIDLGLRWLAARIPPAPRLALVHGDYRIGNVIFGPEGVRAVLDWEQAHLGDPMEDLGWMCIRAWRFGSPLPVGGIGERAEFFRAYETAGARAVEPAAVHFWEVFGNLKWAVICIAQARTFLDGGVPSLELASLGRRTAEAEYDLLALID